MMIGADGHVEIENIVRWAHEVLVVIIHFIPQDPAVLLSPGLIGYLFETTLTRQLTTASISAEVWLSKQLIEINMWCAQASRKVVTLDLESYIPKQGFWVLLGGEAC